MNTSVITNTTPRINLSPVAPHAEAQASARGGDALGGTAGEVRVETLPNGLRMVIADRPGAKQMKIQVGQGAGSLQDPSGKLGLAHLLEHLAFEGSPTRSAPVQEKLRTQMGGRWNAYTDRDSVVYYGIVPTKDARKAASLLTDMYKNPAVVGPRVKQELAAVQNEMIFGDGSMSSELWHVHERLLYGDSAATNNVIGTRKSVQAITAKDMRNYHNAYFTGRNSVVLVEGDAKAMPLDIIRKQLGSLEAGARVDHSEDLSAQVVKGTAIQVVKDPTHKAVDLSLTIPVSAETLASLGGTKTQLILNGLSNQLFNKLRRADHLTYGSWADLVPSDASKGAAIVMQASVAPSAVRDAARDLAQIARDAANGFGAQALKLDKKQFVSGLKMHEPSTQELGVGDVAEIAFQGALLQPGVEIPDVTAPSVRAQQADIDTTIRSINAITLPQYAKYSKQLFNLDDAKVLAFGNVDPTELRAGLTEGGFDAKSAQMNPVDLSMYRQMGLGLPKQK